MELGRASPEDSSRRSVNSKKMLQVSKSTHIRRTKTSGTDPRWKTVSTTFDKTFAAHIIRDKVNNDPNCGIFAVFDGHGGRQVADHC